MQNFTLFYLSSIYVKEEQTGLNIFFNEKKCKMDPLYLWNEKMRLPAVFYLKKHFLRIENLILKQEILRWKIHKKKKNTLVLFLCWIIIF